MDNRTSSSNNSGQGATGNRRPMNAFLLFCKRHRAIVKEKHPHLENRLISKILGEWWTSLDVGEKSKFNNLASEYKEHLMREQPNFSYNKKHTNTVQQTSNNQSASASNSSVKTKNETFVPVIKVPSYESGNKVLEKSEQQDGHGHIVQLQQRSRNEEGSKDTKQSTKVFGAASLSNSRGISRDSSSASTPEQPRSPSDLGNSIGNSNSNASASLGCNTNSSGALDKEVDCPPKTMMHFKKRYLAAEKAKIASSTPSTTTSSNSCSPKNHQELVPLENGEKCSKISKTIDSQGATSEEACEALLQLAGSASNSSIKNVKSVSNSRSRSGTSSPPEGPAGNVSASGDKQDPNQTDKVSNGNSNGKRYKVEQHEKGVVRDAVWTRIAKTLLMQQDASTKEEEEEAAQGDKPMNLSTSSHLQIDGQTIIEHVIENILDKPSEFELGSKRTSAGNSKEGSRSPSDRNINSLPENFCHLNNNAALNGVGTKVPDISCITEEEVKERIYASLKHDLLRRNGDTACKEEINEQDKLRWKTLPHQNLNSNDKQKQQQTTNGVLSGSQAGVQITQASNSSANKVSNTDSKQQTIQSSSATTANCSVAKLSSSLDSQAHSTANHNQLSVSKLPEKPTVQQLQIFTTSVPTGHQTSSMRNSVKQAPVSVTLVNTSCSSAAGQGYGSSHHIPVSTDAAYKNINVIQEDAHPNDLPLNLSTTPPQTPAGMSGVTITASPAKRIRLLTDEDDNMSETQHLRNDRACKGRRYQEFKDQALGRKGSRNNSLNSRPGDRSSVDGNGSSPNHSPDITNTAPGLESQNEKQQSNTSLPSGVQTKPQRNSVSVISTQPFDVEKELNAIPALSLEDFQQKVLNSRQQQQQGHQGRNNSLSPTQNTSSVSVSSVSLAPTSIVSTNHVGAQQASGVSISQASVAIVNNQSAANISYHPQTLVVTKQSPNGTLVTASGLPITMIGSKRPLAAAGASIPSVVPVITYQSGPQEQHQIQIQPVGRGSGKFSKRITTVQGQET